MFDIDPLSFRFIFCGVIIDDTMDNSDIFADKSTVGYLSDSSVELYDDIRGSEFNVNSGDFSESLEPKHTLDKSQDNRTHRGEKKSYSKYK